MFIFFKTTYTCTKIIQFYKDNICGNSWVNRYHSNNKNSQKYCQISQEIIFLFIFACFWFITDPSWLKSAAGEHTEEQWSALLRIPWSLHWPHIQDIWDCMKYKAASFPLMYNKMDTLWEYRWLQILRKRNRWSFKCVIHMKKHYKWLSKKAWNMLTINPMQADKIIYMTKNNFTSIL